MVAVAAAAAEEVVGPLAPAFAAIMTTAGEAATVTAIATGTGIGTATVTETVMVIMTVTEEIERKGVRKGVRREVSVHSYSWPYLVNTKSLFRNCK